MTNDSQNVDAVGLSSAHDGDLTARDSKSESSSVGLSETPMHQLIAKWRLKAAEVDTYHATMSAGWKSCADDLEALAVSSAALPPQEELIEIRALLTSYGMTDESRCIDYIQGMGYKLQKLQLAALPCGAGPTRLTAILDEYRDELTKEASDACEECCSLVMCRFHSLLSMLAGQTEPK